VAALGAHEAVIHITLIKVVTGNRPPPDRRPDRRQSYRNSKDGSESELETCLRLFPSTQDHNQEDR
jgi:hypothetical protein